MFFIHGYLASGDDWYVNDLKNSLVDKVKPLLISDNAKLTYPSCGPAKKQILASEPNFN